MRWTFLTVLWLNDPTRGLVLCGMRGFVWWRRHRIYTVAYQTEQPMIAAAFKQFYNSDNVKSFIASRVSIATASRFVRTGAPISQVVNAYKTHAGR